MDKLTEVIEEIVSTGGIIYGNCILDYYLKKIPDTIRVVIEDGSIIGLENGTTESFGHTLLPEIEIIISVGKSKFKISYEHDKLVFDSSCLERPKGTILIPRLVEKSNFNALELIELFKRRFVVKAVGYTIKRIYDEIDVVHMSHVKKEDISEICTICLDDVSNGWKGKCCNSFYHSKCLLKVLQNFVECPVCRKLI
jgi:hypothetical protein